MDIPIISSPRLIIILAFIAMVILALISFTRISRMNDLSAELNRSNLIKLNLQETYSDLSDATSELNKYILTSDPVYRNRMMDFENKILISIKGLKRLAGNDVRQSAEMLMLDNLIQKRFELMSDELKTTGRDYKKIISEISQSNEQIISMISILKETENKKLVEKESAVQKYTSWTPVMTFAFEIMVTLFLILAYTKTDKELRIKSRLQKELESQVQFKRAILDHSVDLIIVLDTACNLITANKKSSDLLGITKAMIGKNIFALYPTAEKSKSQEAILRALKGEYVHIEKHKAQSIDRTLESFFIPLYKDGIVSAVIILHHDISALALASEELEKKNEQLSRSNQELEQFAYIASHDLQEPLRKIKMYSEFAEKAKSDPEKLPGYLSKIADSAERMSALIKDVLRYSRSTFNESETEAVDLNVICQQVIRDLELLIDEKHAMINVAPLPVIDGHAQHLSQVFLNIIHNALKFCDQQPVIVVDCRTEKEFYVISISDNGIGFDSNYKDQIFEMFKRIPNKKQYSGTGIGLAICRKIINNHNGIITVESSLGKGTTFEIRLPIVTSPKILRTA